jgi:tRNA nucleotidyltransferase (CCA-adding enzyme)
MIDIKNILEEVKFVCRRLQEMDYEAYIVGGAVRDYYVGREPKDWDISTNAKPNQVVEIFDKVIPTGLKFGTVTVHVDNVEVEVTTYRSDGKYSDGRRPDEVFYSESIEDDLSRRDFRMNAMALDPVSGRILDPFGGSLDIGAKSINTVGNPQDRFDEDGLRMMRAIRFASQLSFNISRDVFHAIVRNRYKLKQVSMERIRDELFKILQSGNSRVGIELMCETGMMDFVIPQFMRTKDCLQNKWHSFDVYGHSLSVMENLPPDPILRLGGLLHDIGKPDTQTPHPCNKGEFRFLDHARVGALYVEGISKRLKLSNDDVNRVTHLVRHHMRMMEIPQSESGIRRLIKDLGIENIEEFIVFRRADMVDNPKKQALINEFNIDCERIRNILLKNPVLNSKGLVINGYDLMEYMGISEGPIVGKMIKFLTDRVIDQPELNTREKLFQLLKEMEKNEVP